MPVSTFRNNIDGSFSLFDLDGRRYHCSLSLLGKRIRQQIRRRLGLVINKEHF